MLIEQLQAACAARFRFFVNRGTASHPFRQGHVAVSARVGLSAIPPPRPDSPPICDTSPQRPHPTCAPAGRSSTKALRIVGVERLGASDLVREILDELPEEPDGA